MSDKSNKNTITPLEKSEKIELSKETVLKYISETFEKVEKSEKLEEKLMNQIKASECQIHDLKCELEICFEKNCMLMKELERCRCENEKLKKRIENIKSIMKDL